MEKRRILIVDNNDELPVLEQALQRLGHEVVVAAEREKALRRDDLNSFDLIISNLSEDEVRAFNMGAANYLRLPYNREALREIVEQTLSYKLRYVDDARILNHVHEKIEFELPSDLALMNGVLEYLQDRVAKLGLIQPERSNLFVALDEAFVNAVKHGNKNDPNKLLKITAELSSNEAAFTVEDEGEGFDIREIPDPCDPANLFRTSGRGVLLIYNIMDEVEYNAQGNRVKMIKRPDVPVKAQLVDPNTPDDKHA
ncbi:MAG TPA: ATP-binding protein [Pyrinomonadaceae bacterium]|nr:ATP-binding protein [Pyrinomonadaceae bacterium]